MKTLGFVISKKENEKRRVLIPEHIKNIKNKELIYVETGYGNVLGYSDDDYLQNGVNIASRDEVLKMDIICDPKIGDSEYLSDLKNQTVFGWVHAVQNRDVTDVLLRNQITAFAWEDMYEEGRHVFWRNNEIAGEAAIMHAYLCYGKFPYDTKVAILGRGNIARGAFKILTFMGAEVRIYDRRTEKLFQKELPLYDVVVNAILWDTSRKDHIINREDLIRMKKGAMIVDISCDKNGAIESSTPTSIHKPTYTEDGILHYVVDHTPALFYKTISYSLSDLVSSFVDMLIEECPNKILLESLIIKDGDIIDQKIANFQNREIKPSEYKFFSTIQI